MSSAIFAVPGDLSSPTGGYGYARRLLAEAAAGFELQLVHWPLPELGPRPGADVLAEVAERFAFAPHGWPVLIDGLALGVLPAEMVAGLPGPAVALCHHPLALETGVSPEDAAWLAANERAALAACAGVVTTSRSTADALVAGYGVPKGRIAVARPGTDPAPAAGGSGGPGIAILSVGSLIPRKGHDTLLRAVARLADARWTLDIAGSDRDAGCAAALRGLAEELGIGGRVCFRGAVARGDLDRLYDRSDLFVLASRHEGYGMVYAEAVARGLPVVGSDLPAVAEATGGAALLVPPDDVAALADALATLIGDPARRAALAGRAREAAASQPRWSDARAAVAAAVRALSPEARGAHRAAGPGVRRHATDAAE